MVVFCLSFDFSDGGIVIDFLSCSAGSAMGVKIRMFQIRFPVEIIWETNFSKLILIIVTNIIIFSDIFIVLRSNSIVTYV